MPERGRRTWYLGQVDLFQGLSGAEIADLEALMETRAYGAGELIVGPETPPERVYLVMDGTVRLFHRGPDGRELTVELLGPGRLFGVSALFGTPERTFLAEAVTDAVVCTAEAREFLRVVKSRPQLMLRLAGHIGSLLLQREEQLGRVASAGASARLAAALVRLARDAGQDVPDHGRRIIPRLTHEELAHRVGASRETVTRLLARFERQGYIRREGRRIVVADPEALRRSFDVADEP